MKTELKAFDEALYKTVVVPVSKNVIWPVFGLWSVVSAVVSVVVVVNFFVKADFPWFLSLNTYIFFSILFLIGLYHAVRHIHQGYKRELRLLMRQNGTYMESKLCAKDFIEWEKETNEYLQGVFGEKKGVSE